MVEVLLPSPPLRQDSSQNRECLDRARQQNNIEDGVEARTRAQNTKRYEDDHQTTLRSAFGYAENSQSNTVALLKVVSTTTTGLTSPGAGSLTRVLSGV